MFNGCYGDYSLFYTEDKYCKKIKCNLVDTYLQQVKIYSCLYIILITVKNKETA